MKLVKITDSSHPLLKYISDDPVRPELSTNFRTSNGRFIMALVNDNSPLAIVCLSPHSFVPSSVLDLTNVSPDPSVIVFYTIWSYAAGAGRDLIIEAQKSIESEFPGIQTYVTLSPKTEMARRFHLKNGARELRENPDTINYIYK